MSSTNGESEERRLAQDIARGFKLTFPEECSDIRRHLEQTTVDLTEQEFDELLERLALMALRGESPDD